MTYHTWARMTPQQREAAQAYQRRAGVGVDGLPPSGASEVFWCVGATGAWSWRCAIWPFDVDAGTVEIAEPLPPPPARVRRWTSTAKKARR